MPRVRPLVARTPASLAFPGRVIPEPHPDLYALDAGPDIWTFPCECGANGCRQRVSMTITEYSLLRESGDPVLAPGHDLTPGERIRRWSRSLAADARALQAQARHQVRRAARAGGLQRVK